MCATSERQEARLVHRVLLEARFGAQEVLKRSKVKAELVSERVGELLVHIRNGEALCFARALSSRLLPAMIVVLVNQIPEASSNILVALGLQSIQLVDSLLTPVVSQSSSSFNLFHQPHALVMLLVDVLQVEVHVIEDFLRRHLEAREWLLQVHDLAALAQQEFAEGSHLLSCEEHVPVDDRTRCIGEARDLELLDDVALHMRAREAYWVEREGASGLGLVAPDLLGRCRKCQALIMD